MPETGSQIVEFSIENLITTPDKLPGLQPDYLRVTHHTSLHNASKIAQQGLNYSDQGMAMSTARAWSSPNEVEYATSDPRFGHSEIFIVIFDVPQSEWKLHNNVCLAPGTIPPKYIVGVVKCNVIAQADEQVSGSKRRIE